MLNGMTDATAWRVLCAPGGWVRATRPADDTTVYMHLRHSGAGAQQRLNVHTVVMDSDSPISTLVWRDVPFKGVEDVANDPSLLPGSGRNWYRDTLLEPADVEPVSVVQLERHFGTPDELRTADDPDAHPMPRMMFLIGREKSDPGVEPPPLAKPNGRITDEFLTDLAGTYRWLVASEHSAPATVIADQTGAPVATVRRWISNARQRGFLPPGRPGRAG